MFLRRISAALLTGLAMMLLAPTPHAVAQSGRQFTSPTGNIDCYMYLDGADNFVSCLVQEANWKNPPRRPADCDLDWAPEELSLGSRKSGTSYRNTVVVGACRGDIGPLCGPNECSTLAYGKSVRVGNLTCTSAKTGVTCTTLQGPKRGFTISRSGYKLIR
jgi:hypothetical protein